MLKKYIEYIKDNPKGYWFRRKLFGWGWTPATREGWFIIVGYLLLVIGILRVARLTTLAGERLDGAVLAVLAVTVILIVICYVKGERPRWQWGIPDKKS